MGKLNQLIQQFLKLNSYYKFIKEVFKKEAHLN